MELYLSNLVDLALGKPQSVDCESFNLLHTLLHIILKKLDLSDTRVELTEDLAEKAMSLMKSLPTEPSICFKEVKRAMNASKRILTFKISDSSRSKTTARRPRRETPEKLALNDRSRR